MNIQELSNLLILRAQNNLSDYSETPFQSPSLLLRMSPIKIELEIWKSGLAKNDILRLIKISVYKYEECCGLDLG